MEPYQHTARWIVRRDLGRVTVAGKDAVSFLQALVSNDIAALPVGGRAYATYLTPQGRMISDMHLYRREHDVLLTMPVELAAKLAARLDLLVFTEDVQVADASAAIGQISIVKTDAAAPSWQVDDVFFAPAEEAPVIERLSGQGVQPIAEETFDALRIEAGEPRFGVDMTEETIPLEAGLAERAISQTKGCYVGQEVIIRVLHRGGGRVAKKLMKILLAEGAPDVPPAGTPIVIPALSLSKGPSGAEAGRVTSAARSVRSGRVIALGYVHRDHAEPGKDVIVGGVSATLTGFAS